MMRPRFTRRVGVAPGTITLRLGGLGEMVYPDPTLVPDEPGWYTTLNCMPEYADQPVSVPGATAVAFDPYTDMPTLKGAFGRPLADTDTDAHIRWDLIAMIGGGALIFTMFAGLLASR